LHRGRAALLKEIKERDMKTLVIGDIHGCYREMMALIEKADPGPDDEIIALGDIADRGPGAKQVVGYLNSQKHARSLLGNHELKHIRAFRGEIKAGLSQRIVRKELREKMYSDFCKLLENFPAYIELKEAYLVHGLWEPGLTIQEQDPNLLAGVMSKEIYLRDKYKKPWYELYDGVKPIIVGHNHYRGDGRPLIIKDKVYAIDTGCCHGYYLTGIILPDFKIISVKAAGNYWRMMKRKYYAPP
jgi:serine/threonine protein phosphatase 1